MYNNNRIIIAIALLLTTNTVFCQRAVDTSALIATFSKVMSFTDRPYLHYSTFTKISSSPVLQAEDTVIHVGEFYKSGNTLYVSNETEETFLEDTLLIRVNHSRKSVWINKADTFSKMQFNARAMNYPGMQEMLKNKYVVTQSKTGKTAQLNFVKKSLVKKLTANTTISLVYDTETLLPLKINIDVRLEQPTSEEQIASMKSNGINTSELIKTINNTKYIVRSQSMVTEFRDIVFSEEKATSMPQWKDKIQYSAAGGFAGKGKLREYEVVKTF